MEIRNRAVREALRSVPPDCARVALKECGLTEEESRCLVEHIGGADLTKISDELHLSDRTVDRRRAQALNKLRESLER